MHRFAFAFALLLAACSSDDPSEPDSGRQRLEAAGGDCENVDTVCVETFPPQCYDVCTDEQPGDDGDDCVASDGDLVVCGDDTCVVGIDDSGQEIVICGGPDCVVSYDVETGEETITCPGDDGSGGGGSDPGSSDGDDGSSSNDGAGTEPYPGDDN